MVDLALDSDFSVFLNDRNEIGTVDERAEFEQSVRVMITHFMTNELIGESGDDLIQTKIRLQVSRVARRHDLIDGVSMIDVSQSEDEPGVYKVRINYQSDSMSEFEVSE